MVVFEQQETKGIFMTETVLSKDDIKDYVLPQLKTLEALFLSLKLKGTLVALDFLENVLEVELDQNYTKPQKKQHKAH